MTPAAAAAAASCRPRGRLPSYYNVCKIVYRQKQRRTGTHNFIAQFASTDYQQVNRASYGAHHLVSDFWYCWQGDPTLVPPTPPCVGTLLLSLLPTSQTQPLSSLSITLFSPSPRSLSPILPPSLPPSSPYWHTHLTASTPIPTASPHLSLSRLPHLPPLPSLLLPHRHLHHLRHRHHGHHSSTAIKQ